MMVRSIAIGMSIFYTSKEQLAKRFERPYGLQNETLAEFPAWKERLRRQLVEITGLDTMERCTPNPRVVETVKCDGYTRQKMLIETEPSVTMPFYVLIPDAHQPEKKSPAFLALHGHCGGGKVAVAGVGDDPRVAEQIKIFNYEYAVRLVRLGLLVFVPDARGFGERREELHQGDEHLTVSSCSELNRIAISLGQSVAGMWTWDNMRLTDYISSRDDVDPTRIGIGGLSGGGLQTLWAAALDDRYRCAAISGYFYGFQNSLFDFFCCSCNYVPQLFRTADMGDLAALIAPRPLFIETGKQDWLNGTRGMPNVLEQLEITRKAYALFDAKKNLVHDAFEDGHKWHGKYSEPWIIEQLK